jgi:hypothetical protein
VDKEPERKEWEMARNQRPKAPDGDEWMTFREAASFLGVCVRTFYNWRDSGVIPRSAYIVNQLNRRVLYRRSDLEKIRNADNWS